MAPWGPRILSQNADGRTMRTPNSINAVEECLMVAIGIDYLPADWVGAAPGPCCKHPSSAADHRAQPHPVNWPKLIPGRISEDVAQERWLAVRVNSIGNVGDGRRTASWREGARSCDREKPRPPSAKGCTTAPHAARCGGAALHERGRASNRIKVARLSGETEPLH